MRDTQRLAFPARQRHACLFPRSDAQALETRPVYPTLCTTSWLPPSRASLLVAACQLLWPPIALENQGKQKMP